MKKALVFLSIPFASIAEVIKTVPAKQFKKCVSGEPDLFIKLGKKNASIDRCKMKCITDESCVALQYIAPKDCSLYYSPIEKVCLYFTVTVTNALLENSAFLTPVSSSEPPINDTYTRWKMLMKILGAVE